MKKLFPVMLVSMGSVFLLSACEEGAADSEDIRTSGIHATITVSANEDDRSEVSVILRVGDSNSNTYLDLTSNDRLEATLNNSLTQAVDIQDGNRYRTSFNEVAAGVIGAAYRISFTRPNDVNALYSVVMMPAGLSSLVSSPVTSFNRSTESLVLTWDATNEDAVVPITISGGCIHYTEVEAVASAGMYTINPMTLHSNSDPEENCEITITAKSSTTGTLDLAYGEGGSIVATRTRSISLISTP